VAATHQPAASFHLMPRIVWTGFEYMSYVSKGNLLAQLFTKLLKSKQPQDQTDEQLIEALDKVIAAAPPEQATPTTITTATAASAPAISTTQRLRKNNTFAEIIAQIDEIPKHQSPDEIEIMRTTTSKAWDSLLNDMGNLTVSTILTKAKGTHSSTLSQQLLGRNIDQWWTKIKLTVDNIEKLKKLKKQIRGAPK